MVEEDADTESWAHGCGQSWGLDDAAGVRMAAASVWARPYRLSSLEVVVAEGEAATEINGEMGVNGLGDARVC